MIEWKDCLTGLDKIYQDLYTCPLSTETSCVYKHRLILVATWKLLVKIQNIPVPCLQGPAVFTNIDSQDSKYTCHLSRGTSCVYKHRLIIPVATWGLLARIRIINKYFSF